ncbi:SIR2 family protein [Falsiroseomonas selenitidurans]|uniref:SIR2-like domain-containing protein n=1 Tax=Falsiroseomonas selenitidurans TaxID=2716335 RepID=A0ABX1E552_9PROT|nr:SIR2 family protein [Falsiroseomonas selenitidurans]NKC30637.1 hypothetical protein [Falsiroseomonas selenitidurans]
MGEVSERLREKLENHSAAPFLFVGSGFSRRYLGLEDWVGLLKRFCAPIKDFGYYFSRANGNLALTATYMADDYNEWWWNAPETAESRARSSSLVKNSSDALKIEISSYLSSFSLETARQSRHSEEVASLAQTSIDGIITTNWDFLLEEFFPDYRVFVGQEELLFSNPQAIGEIYKIHGSAQNPSSLVLTAEDYQAFAAKNPYLAAKLVTIFVEHPIIFLGYSITDPHIRSIISSIARCLSQEKIASFQDNLIFVQWVEGGVPAIERATLHSEDFSVTLTTVKLSDYRELYQALSAPKRKVPARILRFFKEQLYELVRSPGSNERKIAVVDLEEIGAVETVEFVVGVGVATRQQEASRKVEQVVEDALAKKGYSGITADEVFADCIQIDSKFDARSLLANAFPGFARVSRTFIPIYRYLRGAGITSAADLSESGFEGAKKIVTKLQRADFTSPSYQNRYRSSFANLSTADIIAKASSPQEAILMLPFQPEAQVELDTLASFLSDQLTLNQSEPYKTGVRKLICRYDKIRFGF